LYPRLPRRRGDRQRSRVIDRPRTPGAFLFIAILVAAQFVRPADVSTARPPAIQPESTWQDHDRAARAAAAKGDWKTFRDHYLRIETILRGHAAVVLALARAESRIGDTAAAFGYLRRYAAMGLARDISADSGFLNLHGSPSWADYQRRVADNLPAIPFAGVVATLPDSDFLAEDVVWDKPRRRFLVSSIRYGRIVVVSRNGKPTEFARTDDGFGMLGLSIDERRGLLWASAEAMPQSKTYKSSDAGRSMLLRYDLSSGRLLRRYDLPRDSAGHEPGDIVVGANGDVYASDGRAGQIWVVRASNDSLSLLVSRGLVSPQGAAPTPDGKRLLVADYSRGIASVDAKTGVMTWIPHPSTTAASGIDGMRMDHGALIAHQNGVTPNRVIRLSLDPSMTRVTGWSIVARDTLRIPSVTHGVIVGDTLFSIANSGWDAFSDDGTLRPNAALSAPRLVAIPLRN
jgi:sugar lactone lactonase YvrE